MNKTPEEIKLHKEKTAESYAFQVPYNGTNDFYNKDKLNAFNAGFDEAINLLSAPHAEVREVWDAARSIIPGHGVNDDEFKYEKLDDYLATRSKQTIPAVAVADAIKIASDAWDSAEHKFNEAIFGYYPDKEKYLESIRYSHIPSVPSLNQIASDSFSAGENYGSWYSENANGKNKYPDKQTYLSYYLASIKPVADTNEVWHLYRHINDGNIYYQSSEHTWVNLQTGEGEVDVMLKDYMQRLTESDVFALVGKMQNTINFNVKTNMELIKQMGEKAVNELNADTNVSGEGWISVQDRTPIAYKTGIWDGQKSDLVLTYNAVDDTHCIANLYEGYLDGNHFKDWYHVDDFEIPTPTHWQPLPEPPKS